MVVLAVPCSPEGKRPVISFCSTTATKIWITRLYHQTKFTPRYGASYTCLKNDFCPTLADLKSPAKLASKYVTEQSTNQIRQIATCRPIWSHCVARKNMSERCWMPISNASARVSNSHDGNTKEAFISPHYSTHYSFRGAYQILDFMGFLRFCRKSVQDFKGAIYPSTPPF